MLQKQADASLSRLARPVKAADYKDAINSTKLLRDNLKAAATASGAFGVQTYQTISRTEELTNSIRKQKLSLAELIRSRNVLNQAFREQMQLQRATAMTYTAPVTGKRSVDLFVPKDAASGMGSFRNKLGAVATLTTAVGNGIIDWGKNVQWAGRQITVGFTMPLAVAAAGAGYMAYTVDQQLTRITKVYDTASQDLVSTGMQQMAVERELSGVRTLAWGNAVNLAKQYGASVKDTLAIQAELAATGQTGGDLIRTTNEVTRIATLGEIDYQTALAATLPLQAAFKLNNEELAESFNYMNAIENATSLSIMDFAESIPRAASGLAELGVTVEQMGILLVSMKEKGVDAAEGANALKSATTRILNPTQAAINQFEQNGIDIVSITQKTQGNLFELIKELGVAMQGMTDFDRQQAIAELFGTYQFNRLNASITSIGDAISGVGDNTSQTARAIEVAAQDSSSWAATASNEINRIMQSDAGKLDRAIQTLLAEIVPFGQAVLGALTPIIEGFSNFIGWLNELPSAAKKFALIPIAFLAVLGPAIMLTGVFANLFGSLIKMVGSLGKLTGAFTLLTPAEKAQQLTTDANTAAFQRQTVSVEQLTASLMDMNRTMQMQTGMAPPLPTMLGPQNLNTYAGAPVATGKSGQRYPAGTPGGLGGQYMKPEAHLAMVNKAHGQALDEDLARGYRKQAEGAAKAQAAGAKSTAATAGNLRMADRSTTLVAAGALMMATSFLAGDDAIGNTLGSLTNIAFIAAGLFTVWPLLASGAKGALGFLTGIPKILSNMKAGTGGILSNIGKTLSVGSKFFLAAGVLGIGYTIINGIVDAMNSIAHAQLEINNSAEDWASILGFIATEASGPTRVNEDGTVENLENQLDLVMKLEEANAAVVDRLREADDVQEQIRLSRLEALKVLSAGGSADNAKQAFLTAMQAAGVSFSEAEGYYIDIKTTITVEPGALAKALTEEAKYTIEEAFADIDTKGFWEKIFGTGGDGVTDAMKADIMEAGSLFGDALGNIDPSDFQTIDLALDEIMNKWKEFSPFDELEYENRAEFDAFNIEGMDDLQEAIDLVDDFQQMMMETGGSGQDDFFAKNGITSENMDRLIVLVDKARDKTEQFTLAEKAFAQEIAKNIPNLRATSESFTTLQQIQDALVGDLVQVQTAQRDYNKSIEEQEYLYGPLTEAQKLFILNLHRARAGLGPATSSAQGFSDAIEGIEQALDQVNGTEMFTITGQQALDSLKDTYTGAMDDIFGYASDIASDQFSDRVEAVREAGDKELDALSKRQEQQQEDFDAMWDARGEAEEAAYDARVASIEGQIELAESQTEAQVAGIEAQIDAIDKQIEVEQAADEVRQRLHENEIRRIERLADMFNNNIDFNAALNSGNLDEAAKIANDSLATQSVWSSEDQERTSGDASSAKQDALDAQKDALSGQIEGLEAALAAQKETLDAQLEALEVEREARRKVLDDTREYQQKMLDEGLAAEREAATARTEANVAAAQAKVDADRRALEIELDTLRQFVPRNEQELAEHTARVQQAYADYGIDLNRQGNEWGKFVGDALQHNINEAAAAIRNEINWAEIANKIATDLASPFSLTPAQLVEWLRTGVFPGTTGTKTDANGNIRADGGWLVMAAHSGGKVSPGSGMTQADRVGVPRSSSLYPSESSYILRQGEWVMPTQAVNKYGSSMMQDMTDLKYEGARHSGGPINGTNGSLEAGFIGAAFAKAVEQAISRGIYQNVEAAYNAAQNVSSLSGGGFPAQNADGSYPVWPLPYPPKNTSQLSANAQAAKNFVTAKWGITNIGGIGQRSNVSDHPVGKAIDVMISNWSSPAGIAQGNEVANHFTQNPHHFGTKYVIWRQQINEGGGWTGMENRGSSTANHMDHPHISFLHRGGPAMPKDNGYPIPQMYTGGKIRYDNTLANLHKNETVLTAGQTRVLEGVKEQIMYNLNVNLDGAIIRDDADISKITRKIKEVIYEVEAERQQNRKVGTR